jgi:hypothetical protein
MVLILDAYSFSLAHVFFSSSNKKRSNRFYSLAPCDFFLFGAMRVDVSQQYFDSLDKLSIAVEIFLDGRSANILQRAFQKRV